MTRSVSLSFTNGVLSVTFLASIQLGIDVQLSFVDEDDGLLSRLFTFYSS